MVLSSPGGPGPCRSPPRRGSGPSDLRLRVPKVSAGLAARGSPRAQTRCPDDARHGDVLTVASAIPLKGSRHRTTIGAWAPEGYSSREPCSVQGRPGSGHGVDYRSFVGRSGPVDAKARTSVGNGTPGASGGRSRAGSPSPGGGSGPRHRRATRGRPSYTPRRARPRRGSAALHRHDRGRYALFEAPPSPWAPLALWISIGNREPAAGPGPARTLRGAGPPRTSRPMAAQEGMTADPLPCSRPESLSGSLSD